MRGFAFADARKGKIYGKLKIFMIQDLKDSGDSKRQETDYKMFNVI
jgi:hypothetical protein